MNYPYYGPYNSAYVSYNEIFDRPQNTMPFRMDLEERPERYYQVPQFYHNDDTDHGYNLGDYNRDDRDGRGNYVPDPIPFPMDREELRQIQVRIRLSSTRNVGNMMSSLSRRGLECSMCARNVLKVTGYPTGDYTNGEDEFLDYVRDFDGGAQLARR